jgi:general secretion pathway protein A
MYEAFYQLREKPFHVTADPSFLYFSKQHQEALEHLLYGIRERLGFLMITGEVGTGKTTLSKALIEQLGPPDKTALILNPNLSGAQFLKAVVRDFGLGPDSAASGHPKPKRVGNTRGELLETIERFLIQEAETGSAVVLIIDEAQALATNTLEQIRLLSNVETPSKKLLQIVLVGQPELAQKLRTNFRLRALHERIAVRYHLEPLDPSEVGAYIEHRIRSAGSKNGFPQFSKEAVALVSELSQGIPRRINLLCDQALLAGFVQESPRLIEAVMVRRATESMAGSRAIKTKIKTQQLSAST